MGYRLAELSKDFSFEDCESELKHRDVISDIFVAIEINEAA